MGRPINKRYFGSIKNELVKSAQNPTLDGSDQAGHVLTDTGVYSEKKLGYNIPVYTARVANAGTAYDEVTGPGEYPYIVKQTGSRSYIVRISATAAEVGKAKLVNKAAGSLAAGEMVLQGFVGGDSGAGTPVNISRLTKFYATDFSGNRYKWHVTPGVGDDSSLANILVLTAATVASVN